MNRQQTRPKPDRAEIFRRAARLTDGEIAFLAACFEGSTIDGPVPLDARRRFDWMREAVAFEVDRRGLALEAAANAIDREEALGVLHVRYPRDRS